MSHTFSIYPPVSKERALIHCVFCALLSNLVLKMYSHKTLENVPEFSFLEEHSD